MNKSNPSEKELKEKLNQVGKDITKLSTNKKLSYDDALIKAKRSLLMLYSEGLKTGFFHIKSHLNQVVEILDEVHSGKQQPTYLTTGLLGLDEVLCGLDAGSLYIIGGGPGMGKTALALTILRHAAVVGKVTTGLFSMDLTGTHIALRLLCMEAKMDSHILRTGNLPKSEWGKIEASVAALSKSRIFIDDIQSISLLKIKHNAIRLKAEHDINLLIIDNFKVLQKRDTQHNTYYLLKHLAVELDIPVIVTSQLGWNSEDCEDRRPVLSDFHYAVEIEEAADTIMLLYRPWFDTLNEADRELAEVIIAKNRKGPTGVINMRFIEMYTAFENVI